MSEILSVKHSTMIAAAGEYYVLARLSLLGKIAAPAPRGVPNADILVSSFSGEKLCAVQVKARQDKGSDGGWHMGKKHEDLKAPGLFYAFVDFGDLRNPKPTTYVIPSSVVANVLQTMHRAWLDNPGKYGQKHNDSDMRRLIPDYTKTSGSGVGSFGKGWLDQYCEAWKLLP